MPELAIAFASRAPAAAVGVSPGEESGRRKAVGTRAFRVPTLVGQCSRNRTSRAQGTARLKSVL